MKKSLRKSIFILFILSLILFVISYLKRNALPNLSEIQPFLFQEPKQTEITMDPFTVTKEDYTYEFTPHYEYELYGLIASEYDAQNWFDISHKNDPLQTKDVCTLWGENVKSDVYKKIKYSHGEWTCYWETKSNEDYKAFSPNQFANNHLIPSNDKLEREIKSAHIGDQIHVKGYLVDYEITTPEGQVGTRDTSTVRTDTGCEIIYVTDFKILEKEHNVFDTIYTFSKYSALTLFILLIGAIFF